MGTHQYQLVYREKGTSGALLQKAFDGEAQVDVREIISRELLHLRVKDISLYRHSLVLDGKPYDIINIVELQARQRGTVPTEIDFCGLDA